MRVAARVRRACLGALVVGVTVVGVVACVADRAAPGAGVLPRGQADEFVRAHNAWRRAAGAASLRWAEDLAASARAHAVDLAAHGCVLAHGPLPLEVGQNLYRLEPQRPEGDVDGAFTVTPTMVVEAWAAESADYSPDTGTCAPTRQCLHYTQIVWPATEEVGCGTAVCPTLGQVWVCNYRPAGNITTAQWPAPVRDEVVVNDPERRGAIVPRWPDLPCAVRLARPPRLCHNPPMPHTAEVVIVGGGCMGASLAWHLARRGLTDVVIVEREDQLAAGSTGRNAGGVRHQFSHEANIALSLESIRAFQQFEDEVGAPIDFHQDGYLFLLGSTESEAAFRRSVATQRRLGVDVEWLAPAEAARLAPGLAVVGVSAATYCARDGICDPVGVTMGYVGAARREGVAVMTGTEVTGVRVEGGRVIGVDTTRGSIDAPTLVDAAGPWARQVGRMAAVDVPVDPLRRHVFIARPGEGATWDDERHRGRVPSTRIMVIDFESTFYCHREGPGLLFGMADPDERPGFDTSVQWDFLPAAIEVATRRFPALADAAVSHAWAGLYEMTPDAMPLIGPAPDLPGFFVLAGFSGHGFQHCPAAGRALADLLTGSDPGLDLTPFAPGRFADPQAGGEHHVV